MKRLAIKSVIVATVISLLASFFAMGVAGEGQALVNPGFETGDLDSWSIGNTPNAAYVSVQGSDSFPLNVFAASTPDDPVVLPRYGGFMARIGVPGFSQLTGVTELYQDFVVPSGGAAEFAYKMCTYDGYGEDYFSVRVSIVEGINDVAVVPQIDVSAPIANTSGAVWCTDWTDVSVDLSSYEGDVARVMVSAGGSNTIKSTWAYVDAPTLVVPDPDPEPTPPGDATSATVDVKPDTLNLGSTDGGDGAVTVFLELPAGLDLNDLDAGSLVLLAGQAQIAPAWVASGNGDYDGDGVPDRMVKFRRSDIAPFVAGGASVTFSLSGLVGETPFLGWDEVRVLEKASAPATARNLKP